MSEHKCDSQHTALHSPTKEKFSVLSIWIFFLSVVTIKSWLVCQSWRRDLDNLYNGDLSPGLPLTQLQRTAGEGQGGLRTECDSSMQIRCYRCCSSQMLLLIPRLPLPLPAASPIQTSLPLLLHGIHQRLRLPLTRWYQIPCSSRSQSAKWQGRLQTPSLCRNLHAKPPRLVKDVVRQKTAHWQWVVFRTGRIVFFNDNLLS